MKFKFLISLLVGILFLFGCSKKDKKSMYSADSKRTSENIANESVKHFLSLYYKDKWDEEAALFLISMKDKRPADFEINFLLGLLKQKNENYNDAIAYYKKALKHKPDDKNKAIIYNNIGNAYYLMSEFDKALTNYKKAVSFSPNMASAHFNMGGTYHAKFEFDKGREEFEIAKNLNPQLFKHQSKTEKKKIDEYLSKDELVEYFLKSEK